MGLDETIYNALNQRYAFSSPFIDLAVTKSIGIKFATHKCVHRDYPPRVLETQHNPFTRLVAAQRLSESSFEDR